MCDTRTFLADCMYIRDRSRNAERQRGGEFYIRTYRCIYVQVYIAIVPCFHSFAERSKELCRRGIKSLNDATMKEGSIGTRNCTVNTEKNVVTGRSRGRRAGWRTGARGRGESGEGVKKERKR